MLLLLPLLTRFIGLFSFVAAVAEEEDEEFDELLVRPPLSVIE